MANSAVLHWMQVQLTWHGLDVLSLAQCRSSSYLSCCRVVFPSRTDSRTPCPHSGTAVSTGDDKVAHSPRDDQGTPGRCSSRAVGGELRRNPQRAILRCRILSASSFPIEHANLSDTLSRDCAGQDLCVFLTTREFYCIPSRDPAIYAVAA